MLRRAIAERDISTERADTQRGCSTATRTGQSGRGTVARGMLGLLSEAIVDVAAEGVHVVAQAPGRRSLQIDMPADGVHIKLRLGRQGALDAHVPRVVRRVRFAAGFT